MLLSILGRCPNGGAFAVLPAADMGITLHAMDVGIRVTPDRRVGFEVKLLEPGPNSSNSPLYWIGIEFCSQFETIAAKFGRYVFTDKCQRAVGVEHRCELKQLGNTNSNLNR